MQKNKAIEILLAEDNEGDYELAKEAFERAKYNYNLTNVKNGDDATDFLLKKGKYKNIKLPDIIILDMNLPRASGKEMLSIIRNDDRLKRIPVFVFTSSKADKDILESYNLGANCYISKPFDALKFMEVIRQIEYFWIDIAVLPPRDD